MKRKSLIPLLLHHFCLFQEILTTKKGITLCFVEAIKVKSGLEMQDLCHDMFLHAEGKRIRKPGKLSQKHSTLPIM